MPRMTSAERAEALKGAIDRVHAAIDADLARHDYDSAWAGAQALYDLLHTSRGDASKARARVIDTYRREDRRSLAEAAERFGISKGRADQLVRLAREDAE